MRTTCVNCGKAWGSPSRSFDGRRCTNLAACVTRALGPSPAKSEAKRMARGTP